MNELIRKIRQTAGMSQEQFAHALGTTALSINRWENGKNKPTGMAQKNLVSFCQEHNIPLVEMVIDAMKYEKQDDKLILFHGSKAGITGNIAPISRAECDFGKGFYMGTNPVQPLTLICSEAAPVFYTVGLDLTGLKVLSVKPDMDWAMLISYHRKEMETAKGTALIHCLCALKPGKQYVAVTEKACRQIRILDEKKLSMLELSALMESSVARRKEGVALAKEIEVKYRREGRFFDEILRGVGNA